MPAVTQRQRTAIAIAEHEPGKLYARNKSMLQMTKSQQHDFASTKGLGKIGPPLARPKTARSPKSKSLIGS